MHLRGGGGDGMPLYTNILEEGRRLGEEIGGGVVRGGDWGKGELGEEMGGGDWGRGS